MTLRLEQVAGELPSLVRRYREEMEAARSGLDAAGAALGRWQDDPDTGNQLIRDQLGETGLPFALASTEPPGAVFAAPPIAAVTVVAADGSSIEPDRFAPVPCYVTNTGRVVLPYGTAAIPSIGSEARVGPPGRWDEGEDTGEEIAAGGLGVNLVRDVEELEAVESLAHDALADAPVVALRDGTLLPWDLDSRQVAPAIRDEMKRRTRAALDGLRDCGDRISLGAYVSGSRASEVVNSLRALAPATPRWPATDAALFAGLLADGERSALFRSQSGLRSRIEADFRDHEVWSFYLRVGGDIARVELPGWAAGAEHVGRLHATIVDQCARCGGYPRALQEAHEQAVISMGDRLQFARLLEREALRQGLAAATNGKQLSKRRRAV